MPLNLFNAACGAAAALAVPLAAVGFTDWAPVNPQETTETVEIAPGSFAFPRPGQFLLRGRRVDAPVDRVSFDRPVTIMKFQVTSAAYRKCVAAGACREADAAPSADAAVVPVTGVSYLDAQAYASWYSEVTGATWRLPTAAEWAYAAAERFVGDPTVGVDDPDNPAVAWIRRYRQEAADRREPDPLPRVRGSYGPNANGVYDLAGNIWEWTSTCYRRVTLGGDSARIEFSPDQCGINVAEGRHRAYMPNFVRDGKSGACAVDTPPDNLGFRLVLDAGGMPVVARLVKAMRALVSIDGERTS